MTATTRTIRMTTPAELVSAIPFMVGFAPADTDTFVIVHAEPRGRVVLTARIDTDAPAEAFAEHVEYIIGAAVRSGAEPTRLTAVRYEPTLLGSVDHHAVLCAVADSHGMTVSDSASVTDGLWSSYLCANPACCPTGGTPVDGGSATVTAFVAEGLTATSSTLERVTFAGDALPLDGDDAALYGWSALLAAPLDASVLLALAGAFCGDYATRDSLIADAARMTADDRTAALDLTFALLRRLPDTDPRLPMVASVAAWMTLMHDGGVLTRYCLERIPYGTEPTLGALVQSVRDAGTSPDLVRYLASAAVPA